MNALVHGLARLARRAPVVVVVSVVVLTAVFGFFSGQQELDAGNEAFSPDNEELTALEFSGEAFGGSSDTLMQVIVEGGDVVSPEGLATVQAVRDAVTGAVPEEQLGGQPGQGPVVSYLAPVEAALQAQQSPATGLDDAAVDRLYQEGLDALPAEVQGLTRQLVAGDEPLESEHALMLVFLDTEAIAGDASGDQVVSRIIDVERRVNEAVGALDTPLDVTAFGFELLFEPDDTFQQEVGRLFGVAALVIVGILFLVYLAKRVGRMTWPRALRRSGADVGLTLFAILASITWMQGIGVLLGPDYLGLLGGFTPPTQIIPVLLIGLGVDYAIHLTSRYREELGEGAEVQFAVRRAVTTVGVALVLATVTTVIGFLTNLANPIPAIADFGVLAAVGIAVAFLLMLTVVPAARLLLDRRAERGQRIPRQALAATSESLLSRTMARTSLLAEHAPVPVLVVTLALGGLGAYGLTRLSTEFSFTDFLPEGSPLKGAFETIDERFSGGFGERTQVLVRGDVARPAVHNATVEAQQALADTDGVVLFGEQAAATSPVTLLQQALAFAQGSPGPADGGAAPPGAGGQAPPGAEGQAAPGAGDQAAPGGQAAGPGAAAAGPDPQAVARLVEVAMANGARPDGAVAADADVPAIYEALLEAFPDQAAAVLAREGSSFIASQVTVTTQSGDVGAVELADALEEDFAPVAQAGPSVIATSNEIVSEVIVNELSASQASSLGFTLLAALALLVAVFAVRERRPALGALTLAPVALVVLWVFGTMAATGIPFGPVTATISALAIGIGVPFTIHITHRFTEDLSESGDIDRALRSTMTHTGGALAGSALTTMAGFAVLVTSSLTPFRQLGLVTAYAIGYALIAAVLVLPSLLALWARWHARRGSPAVAVEAPERTPARA